METVENRPVLSVNDLKVYFYTKRGVGKAVDGVNFQLRRGETMGLVGESGCGKTVTALAIMGLHPKPAARIVGGQVLFNGEDLLAKTPSEMRQYRGRRIAMVLQDPITALNPVFTVENQVGEPLRLHQRLKGAHLRQRAIDLLKLLRIPAAEERLSSYPHMFSGGMRQRVVGAIALSCEPEILIADEPTTSLDVTVEAAYLALLKGIQREKGVAILYITHDFGVVAKMCDRTTVMYAGRVVESAPTWELFDHPAHPYAEALLDAVPDVRVGNKRLLSIKGYPPSIYELPTGCPFHPRCPDVMPKCSECFPAQVKLKHEHIVSCWKYL
jgi:oligopeptide/dipeptide ABC transporter ATP-binding protein